MRGGPGLVSVSSARWPLSAPIHAELDEGSILIETRKLPSVSLERIGRDLDAGRADPVRAFRRSPAWSPKSAGPTWPRRRWASTRATCTCSSTLDSGRPADQGGTDRRDVEATVESDAGRLVQLHPADGDAARRGGFRNQGRRGGEIFGEDFAAFWNRPQSRRCTLSSVPGAADAQMEIVSGVAELRVDLDRRQLARYGLNVSDVSGVIETAIGGRTASELIEGQRRFRDRGQVAGAVS